MGAHMDVHTMRIHSPTYSHLYTYIQLGLRYHENSLSKNPTELRNTTEKKVPHRLATHA